jgi:hypothetical protein
VKISVFLGCILYQPKFPFKQKLSVLIFIHIPSVVCCLTNVLLFYNLKRDVNYYWYAQHLYTRHCTASSVDQGVVAASKSCHCSSVSASLETSAIDQHDLEKVRKTSVKGA